MHVATIIIPNFGEQWLLFLEGTIDQSKGLIQHSSTCHHLDVEIDDIPLGNEQACISL